MRRMCTLMMGLALFFASYSGFAQNNSVSLECVSEPESHHNSPSQKELLRIHRLAVQCARDGYAMKAIELLNHAFEIARKTQGTTDEHIQSMHHWCGYAYNQAGDFQSAKQDLQKALRMSESLDDSEKDFNIKLALCETYIFLGEYASAQLLLDALGEGENTVSRRLSIMSAQAVLFREQGQYASAERLFRQSLMMSSQINESPKEYHRITVPLAVTLIAQNKLSEAKTLLNEALVVRLASDSAYRVANVRLYLAEIARLEGHELEAKVLYQRALEQYADTVGLNAPYALLARKQLNFLNS